VELSIDTTNITLAFSHFLLGFSAYILLIRTVMPNKNNAEF